MKVNEGAFFSALDEMKKIVPLSDDQSAAIVTAVEAMRTADRDDPRNPYKKPSTRKQKTQQQQMEGKENVEHPLRCRGCGF